MKLKVRLPKIEDVALMYYLLVPIIRGLIFSHLPGRYYLMDFILVLMIAYKMLKSRNFGREYIDILVFYLVVFLLFFLKFFANPSMYEWISRDYGIDYMFRFAGVFAYPVIRIQRNPEQMLKVLKTAGIILGLYYAYQSLEVIRYGYWSFTLFGSDVTMASNMSWSYGVLFSICCLSIFVINDKKIIFLLPMVLGLVGIMAYGSRGTIVAFAFGLLLAVLFIHEGKMKTRNYVMLGLFVAGIAFLFSDTGLFIITNWFQAHGLSSRFLHLLTAKQTFEVASHGRSRIWLRCIELIRESPILGHGVYGERNAIYALGYRWGYAHNIFLEILVSFGWIIGGLISALIVIGIIRMLRKGDSRDEKLVFLIFLTASLELLVSNSIWLHFGLWALLGLYVNHFKGKWYLQDKKV